MSNARIEGLSGQVDWVDSGQGWQAKETTVRLQGWSRQRRAIVLRRGVKRALASSSTDDGGQPRLAFADTVGARTFGSIRSSRSLVEALASFGQLYRDRADGENILDELKNQWGWGGFVTHDLARCRLAARWSRCFTIGGHLRSAGRTGLAQRSDHEPAVAVARHRRAGAPCPTDDDQDRQHARPRGSAAAALRAVAAFLRA